jgi:hypothetical protein
MQVNFLANEPQVPVVTARTLPPVSMLEKLKSKSKKKERLECVSLFELINFDSICLKFTSIQFLKFFCLPVYFGTHINTMSSNRVPTTMIKGSEAIAVLFAASWFVWRDSNNDVVIQLLLLCTHLCSLLVCLCFRDNEVNQVIEQLYVQWHHAIDAKRVYTVVFISFDSSEEEYHRFTLMMPNDWYTIGFNNPKRIVAAAALGVRGQPTLVLLGPDGCLISRKGRTLLTTDLYALNFPWKPASITELLTGDVVQGNNRIPISSLVHKFREPTLPTFAFYFGALWNRTCRAFHPKLFRAHQLLKENWIESYGFNLIYASCDIDRNEYCTFQKTLPFCSFDFEDVRAKQLAELLEVGTFPAIVIIDAEGRVVNKHAVDMILTTKDEQYNLDEFPWARSPFYFLNPLLINNKGDKHCFEDIQIDHQIITIFYGARRYAIHFHKNQNPSWIHVFLCVGYSKNYYKANRLPPWQTHHSQIASLC